ncbi:hypothetical protein ABK040_001145 [Willaertia magna]
MIRKQAFSLLRNSNKLIFNTHNSQIATYATAAKGAELDELVRKVLKPEVLKVIEGKTDSLLIKKLNFLGRYLVCRLNVANQLILNSLSQENCFRIIVNELPDCWEYYWKKVKDNGKDAAKWLESLNEVKDLPLIADRCWRTMLLSGVYPTTEHYNVLFEVLGNTNENFFIHDMYDDLKRRNPYQNPDAKTFNTVLANYINHQDGQRVQLQLDYMRSKKIAVDPSLEGPAKELVGQYDPEKGASWALDKGGVKPEFEVRKETAYEKNQAKIMDSLEKYIQPEFSKLVVKD